MPIVNVHCSEKAYVPELLEKLGSELGEILARMLLLPGMELSKKSIKIFFFKNGPHDVCDKDLVIHVFANYTEERERILEANTETAAEEVKKIIESLAWTDDKPPHGFIYPFLGLGEIGEF